MRKKKFNPNYTKRKQRRGVNGLTTLGFDNNWKRANIRCTFWNQNLELPIAINKVCTKNFKTQNKRGVIQIILKKMKWKGLGFDKFRV